VSERKRGGGEEGGEREREREREREDENSYMPYAVTRKDIESDLRGCECVYLQKLKSNCRRSEKKKIIVIIILLLIIITLLLREYRIAGSF